MGMQDRDWYRQERKEQRHQKYPCKAVQQSASSELPRRSVGSGAWLLLALVIAIFLILGFS
ncbi:hypothetical protein D9M68_522810 [compost metagenome]